jgi:acetyltransferase-like isoleucine patch superfamily enzyme
MKRILTFLFGCIPINGVKIFLLRAIGHDISYKAKIGVSLYFVKHIKVNQNAKIKSFNFLKLNELYLEENAFIGKFNIIKGPFKVHLEPKAGISKSNKIRRAYAPITYGEASLHLGSNSIIVSDHFLDLTRSVVIGSNSIVAGIGTQFWTHGYYHADEGVDRIRIDGEIKIGDNVYIGSKCLFNPGVRVENSIHIGGGSVISKNLVKSGMYVSQGLRYIENDINHVKAKLKKVDADNLIEQVYTK